MLLVLRLLYKELRKVDVAFNRDPRTSVLPLLGPPWPMLAILALYLITVTKWGPKLMANRKPINVKTPMQIYNLFQVALNTTTFIISVRYSYLKSFNLSCQAYNPMDTSPDVMVLRYPAYAYYLSKYIDLLDTVFFVLRKSNRQITFLHVYHHTIMVFGVWVYCTLNFASHFTATGIINSFIHICMYSYYFLAALKPAVDLKPWKRRLTQLQILQFCTLTIHLSLPILNNWCGLDMFWIWVAFLQNLFILLLFCDFYYRTYLVGHRKKLVKGTGRCKKSEAAACDISSSEAAKFA